ncbi:MAG: hypothetical protein HYV97_00065 [Bdellovibrio sp.]|nr:hypothetical protein [Bdellovibrio sp.]
MGTKGAAETQEEQGFNEKELEDIMSEIESLESEFEEEEKGCTPDAQQSDESEEVAEIPKVVKKSVPTARPKVAAAEEVESPVKSVKISNAPTVKEVPCSMPAQMEFHVQGDMRMNLKFFVGETWVQFSANPSEGLVIEMPGGMRFSVPVPGVANQKSKKAS